MQTRRFQFTSFVAGCVVGLLGIFFVVAGGELLLLGGSVYYLLAGIGMTISGVLLALGQRAGLSVYLCVWAATLCWAVWESGFDVWRLMPRIVAPSVLLAVLYLPTLVRVAGRHRGASGSRAVLATIAVFVLLGGGWGVLHVTPIRAVAAPPNLMAPRSATANADWPAYGGTDAGRRFSALDQITPENVATLAPAWVQRTGDVADPAETIAHKREYHSEATPIHVGQTLYTCSPHSWVEAIDANTGATKWTWKRDSPLAGNDYLVCRGVSYFAAPAGTPCEHRIFAPTFDARIVALDADTGRECKGFAENGYINLRDNTGPSAASFQISTSPPLVANGMLIVGDRILDNFAVDEPSGVVRAYDAISGRLVWAWDMGRGQDAIGPLPAGEIYTRGTPNVWGAMTADTENGLVYLPLGGATPDYWGGHRRPFDDRFGSSLTALDVKTGKLRWSFQLVHHDVWDMDLPVGPSLVDLPAPGGAIVPALVQTNKMGELFVLNRLTGVPITRVEERAVETRGGTSDDKLSPTQPFSVGMPSFTPPPLLETDAWGATPIDQLICRIEFKQARVSGIYVPIGPTPAIGHPAFDGVSDWGGAAIDPERGILTINTMEMPFRIRLVDRTTPEGRAMLVHAAAGGENAKALIPFTQFGTPWIAAVQAWLGPFGAPCNAPPWGMLTAVDLRTHKVLWDKTLGTARDTGLFGSHLGLPLPTGVPNLGGSMITRGGIVFIAATTDQYLRAFDVRDGRELWKARLPAGAQATPMTYLGQDGRQFVVVTAGGHGGLNTRYGDYTMAFALPHGK